MKRQALGAALLLIGSVAPLMARQAEVAGQTPPAATQQTAAPAAGGLASQAETADVEEGKKTEKVCKLMAVSGTRFKSRLCYTQEQWDAIDRAHKDKMREIDSQPVLQKTN